MVIFTFKNIGVTMLVFPILVRVGLGSTNFITKEKIKLSLGIFHLDQGLDKNNLLFFNLYGLLLLLPCWLFLKIIFMLSMLFSPLGWCFSRS